jgi:predicted metal-dependent enzyme (double-stranded beta helix superfamily)
MFDPEQLIEDCRGALGGKHTARQIRDVLTRALSEPAAVVRVLGEPQSGGVNALYRSPELTILDVHWRANMVLMPHDHQMWAVVGVYAGREDNILWRRLPDDADGRIEAAGAKSLADGDVLTLGPDAIHSVINPLTATTGAIHIYGGDFFANPRSEWDPWSLRERPLDMERVLAMLAG